MIDDNVEILPSTCRRSRVVETAKALSSMRICRVAAMEASWYGFISTLNAILGQDPIKYEIHHLGSTS